MTLLERGVHETPYRTIAGAGIAIAINSQGCRVGELMFVDDIGKQVVMRALWQILDEVDPMPMLKLA